MPRDEQLIKAVLEEEMPSLVQLVVGKKSRVITVAGKSKEWGVELEKAPADVVYVGRCQSQGGWMLKTSVWHNPFSVKQAGTREEAIRLYREYITDLLEERADGQLQSEFLRSKAAGTPAQRRQLLELRKNINRKELEKLRGKTLGCWCSPLACHADVLVELLG